MNSNPKIKIFKTSFRDDLVSFLQGDQPRVCISAPTGYGKTFGIGQVLAKETKEGKCYFAFPFRISVKKMFEFHVKGSPKGHVFGYAMRGSQKRVDSSRVLLATGGWLLEKLLATNLGPRDVVVLDEVHCPHRQFVLLIKYLEYVQHFQGFKMIYSSATLQPRKDIPLLKYGQENTVQIHFMSDGLIQPSQILCWYRQHGKTLVILPGKKEIGQIVTKVESLFENEDEIHLLSIYSGIEKEELEETVSFFDSNENCILFSTDIAENSITFMDLQCVIDFALRKTPIRSDKGIHQLVTKKASRSNLLQSVGRCGRFNSIGHGYLAISEEEYDELEPYPPVESDPLWEVLKLIENNKDPREILSYDLEEEIKSLVERGFLDVDEKITDRGLVFSRSGLSKDSGKFFADCWVNGLIKDPDCTYAIFWICSWLDHDKPFFYLPKKKVGESRTLFNERKEIIKDIQSEFFLQDSLATEMSVWDEVVSSGKKKLKSLCFSKKLSEFSIRAFKRQLESLMDRFKVEPKHQSFVIPQKVWSQLQESLDNFRADSVWSRTGLKIVLGRFTSTQVISSDTFLFSLYQPEKSRIIIANKFIKFDV